MEKTSIIYNGERWDLFSCEYEFEGKTFSIEFRARGFEEAEQRRESIMRSLKRPLQIVSETPAPGIN